jgi:hypothetical protein
MATRFTRIILIDEMVVGMHIESNNLLPVAPVADGTPSKGSGSGGDSSPFPHLSPLKSALPSLLLQLLCERGFPSHRIPAGYVRRSHAGAAAKVL